MKENVQFGEKKGIYRSKHQNRGVRLSKDYKVNKGPFNFQGGGGGGGGEYGFFSKKNILIPNVAEKNILILVEEKKNNLIQSFCHIT